MRALLDVNVLIAILDADHALHDRALDWIDARPQRAWASCPITQNGCVRIMANPKYPSPLPAHAIMARLGEACATGLHEFWPDDVTLLDTKIADPARIHGPRQVTDVYLLALAVQHAGRLVTFDASIARDAVKGASKQHLLVL